MSLYFVATIVANIIYTSLRNHLQEVLSSRLTQLKQPVRIALRHVLISISTVLGIEMSLAHDDFLASEVVGVLSEMLQDLVLALLDSERKNVIIDYIASFLIHCVFNILIFILTFILTFILIRLCAYFRRWLSHFEGLLVLGLLGMLAVSAVRLAGL
jgi:hypothetical protein